MAARKPPLHKAWTPEKVRQRIQTALITRRLTRHVLGKVEMSPTQVTAALGLLKKTLPDLSAVEHSGEVKHRDISDQPLSADEWEKQYAGDLETAGRPPESVN
jgi:hypothetical protein